jgi:hypothetical protein
MATLLIGPKQHRFKVNKRLICATSPFFAERFGDPSSSKSISLWLPRESSSMFSLFVDWVHLGLRFRPHLEEMISNAYDAGTEASQDIHWCLIRLHLFASRLGLYRLQDLAMDAIQDLYLRCDWDVPSGLIRFLYTECEDLAAIRLRRWAVAMVAFSFTGGPRLTLKRNPQPQNPLDLVIYWNNSRNLLPTTTSTWRRCDFQGSTFASRTHSCAFQPTVSAMMSVPLVSVNVLFTHIAQVSGSADALMSLAQQNTTVFANHPKSEVQSLPASLLPTGGIVTLSPGRSSPGQQTQTSKRMTMTKFRRR